MISFGRPGVADDDDVVDEGLGTSTMSNREIDAGAILGQRRRKRDLHGGEPEVEILELTASRAAVMDGS